MRILLFGTFDRLHPGHRFVIDEAVKRGDVSVVVGRDRNVESFKGRTPMQPQEERMRALQEAYPQATIILGEEIDFLAPVRSVQPDLILLGYDQRMPPGVNESDLPCAVERLAPFQPEKYKSSLMK